MTQATRPSIAGSHDFVRAELVELRASIERFRQGKIPDAVFLEHRLRFGIYGQRQDGVHMLRSKLPLGLIGPDQLEAFADIAERFGHGVAHLTTRQDIQVHFVTLEQTPDLLDVLDQANMTAREACGNVVRNVTASPLAGVQADEVFDVTPYGAALAEFLLRHPDGQSLGRKFKITLAGSDDPAWNLSLIHDLGLTARVDQAGGHGFHVLVGGGLGAVPHEAQVLTEFLPVAELLPTTLAIIRLFGRFGEKKKRARARLKFLVAEWGIERFRAAVAQERAELGDRVAPLALELEAWADVPLHAPSPLPPGELLAEDLGWLQTNTLPQRQPGYRAVRVRVPRGDLSPAQLRGLAGLLREHCGDTARIGPDQSLLLRWVPEARLLQVRDALSALELGQAHAAGVADPVTCPGADTCKLGITSPRAAARHMGGVLDELAADSRLRGLRIHISGCPNSCAQHQIADIGFYGAARTVQGAASPHYTVLLGGMVGGRGEGELGSGFGTPVTKVPAARMGEAVRLLTGAYVEHRQGEEPFGAFARRMGRRFFKDRLEPVTAMASLEEAPELYREPGQEEPFVVKRGVGECAGAVVDLSDLLMADADRYADQAVDLLEAAQAPAPIREAALQAFRHAARALLATEGFQNPADFDLVTLFEVLWQETGRIPEGVGHYFLQASREPAQEVHGDRLRRLVVESTLFVDEAHTILSRLRAGQRGGSRD